MDYSLINQAICAQMKVFAHANVPFQDAVLQLMPSINKFMSYIQQNKIENFHYLIDLLKWHWEEVSTNVIDIEVYDQFVRSISPDPDGTDRIISQEKAAANEWRIALEEAGLTPMEALGMAKDVAHSIASQEQAATEVVQHPSAMAIPQTIVQLYRQFYRASKGYQAKAADIARPIDVVMEVIGKSSSNGEELSQEVMGALSAKMRQIHASTAAGRWVLHGTDELVAIKTFADFMVHQVLGQRFNHDKAAFLSKSGMGLIRDASIALYQLEDQR